MTDRIIRDRTPLRIVHQAKQGLPGPTGEAATQHNVLVDLQGGAAGEYYHLTAAEYGYLAGQDQGVKSTDAPTFAGGSFTGDLGVGTADLSSMVAVTRLLKVQDTSAGGKPALALAGPSAEWTFLNTAQGALQFLYGGGISGGFYQRNFFLGNNPIPGTSAFKVAVFESGTAPTSQPADAAQMYVADLGGVAGKAGFHFMNEDGTVLAFDQSVAIGAGVSFGTITCNNELRFVDGLTRILHSGSNLVFRVDGAADLMTLSQAGKLSLVNDLEIATGSALARSRYKAGAHTAGFDVMLDTGGAAYVYNRNAGPVIFGTNNTEKARIDTAGNFGLSLTTFGTGAVRAWGMAAGTAPTSQPADAAQMYVADVGGVAGKAGFHFMAEDGTVHAFGRDVLITDISAASRATMNTEIGWRDATGAEAGYIGFRGTADLAIRSTAGNITLATYAANVLNLVGDKAGIGMAAPKAKLHGTGSTILGTAAAAVADADIGNGETNVYLDEVGNNLVFRVRKSDGTYATGTVAIA